MTVLSVIVNSDFLLGSRKLCAGLPELVACFVQAPLRGPVATQVDRDGDEHYDCKSARHFYKPPPLAGLCGQEQNTYLAVRCCTKVHSLSVGNRVYLKRAGRNQVHVSVRTNRRNHSTKKSNSKELLTTSRGYPGKHESVGLHSTLEQEIRDYVAGVRQAAKSRFWGTRQRP